MKENYKIEKSFFWCLDLQFNTAYSSYSLAQKQLIALLTAYSCCSRQRWTSQISRFSLNHYNIDYLLAEDCQWSSIRQRWRELQRRFLLVVLFYLSPSKSVSCWPQFDRYHLIWSLRKKFVHSIILNVCVEQPFRYLGRGTCKFEHTHKKITLWKSCKVAGKLRCETLR